LANQNKYSYPYPRPSLTVDAVVFTFENGELKVLLIKRAHEPFKDQWAFPGGFVDENETVEAAVLRELAEETGLKDIELKQFYTASAPGRDPRGWTVSTFFYGYVPVSFSTVTAGDDAGEAAWYPVAGPPAMGFDHRELLRLSLEVIRKEAIGFITGTRLFPDTFTQKEILDFYRQITGTENIAAGIVQRLLDANGIVICRKDGKYLLKFNNSVMAEIRRNGFIF